MKRSVFLILMLFSIVSARDFAPFRFQDGEELIYKVKYSFFNLGTIKMQVRQVPGDFVPKRYHIHMLIESNPLLFWVDNHSVYDSYIDENLRVLKFVSNENMEGEIYRAEYTFDYRDSIITRRLYDRDDVLKKSDKQKIRPNMIDGISLIFFARANAHKKVRDTVYTFIENKSGDVIFNFKNEKHHTKSESLPEGLETVYFDGQLNISGIAGVSGPFSAYFSRDASRVPFVSYMKVFIGSVELELIGWKGWQPGS